MKKMSYISTRSSAAPVSFEQALLQGLAPDGGLYVPSATPKFSGSTYRRLARAGYAEVATACWSAFMGGFLEHEKIKQLAELAYSNFKHQAVAPLRQLDSKVWLLELWHGESHSFKDIAMQVLAPLLDEALARQGKRASILCATSGDTGSAAMAAFARSARVDVFVLYPSGGISEVQRKQMTSHTEEHIHALELQGNFDDCQKIVKQLFNDAAFAARVNLAAVNSINWARIMAQVVYYWTTCLSLGGNHQRKINFIVPTGNFGDIYAGYVAKKMGAPIAKLVIANNDNRVLTEVLSAGVYRPGATRATLSPAMDIQAPSNFERLLFDVYNRRPSEVATLFNNLEQAGEITFAPRLVNKMRKHFMAASASDEEILEALRTSYQKTGHVIDPHTACGWVALEKTKKRLKGHQVILSTASPAKFNETIKQALGFQPPSSPAPLTFASPERFEKVENNAGAVAAFIEEKRSG